MGTQKSRYLQNLPALYNADKDGDFFAQYLKIFEKILTGLEDSIKDDNGKEIQIKGLGQTLDVVSDYVCPYRKSDVEHIAPKEFLDWLSSWVGLALKEDWSEEKKREVMASIVPLYRIKGTRLGLEKFLNIYTNGGVKIYDNVGLFQVGINSQVGTTSVIDSINSFIVEVTLSELEQNNEAFTRKKKLIETIIEMEKPIHANYQVVWTNVPSMQLPWGLEEKEFGHSKVGENTLLWSYNK